MTSSIKMIKISQVAEDFIEKYEQLSNMELEVRFGKFDGQYFDANIDRMTFGRISNYCDSFFRPFENIIEELDVYVTDSQRVGKRITIKGKTNIEYFMTFGNIKLLNIENISVILQKNKENDDYQDLNVRISLAQESPLEKNTNMDFEGITLLRHKYRQSYYAMNDKFRLDNTIVKEYKFNRGQSKNITNLEIKDFSEKYQFEIEAIGKVSKSDIESIVTEFVVFIQDTGYITLNSETANMQSEYNRLTGTDNKFIGLKPITVTPDNKKDVNLSQQEYSVTLKADGERYLLFVSKQIYFISMNMKFIDTGLSIESNLAEINYTILDGEYLKEKNEYLIFDIFYYKGQDVRKFNLKERINMMNEFEESIKKLGASGSIKSKHNFIQNRPTLDIHCKKYYFESEEGTDLKTLTNNLLEISSSSSDSGYKYDGVIFTPNTPYVSDIKIYKWKKHEDNTIDFYISSFDDRVRYGNVEYIKCPLFVGSSEKPVKPIIFKPNLSKSEFTEQCVSFIYIPVGTNGPKTIQDQLQIQPGCIIECAWLDLQKAHNTPNPIKQYGWVALRIRLDKTSKIYTNNDFQGTMNNGWVANQIWNSIENPIKIQDLFTERYYSSTSRESVAEPMHRFHNFIKTSLIRKYGYNKAFIDFTCGQGADIRKWNDAKLKAVIGLDKNEENIKKLLARGNINVPHLFSNFESNLPLFSNEGLPIGDNWKLSELNVSIQDFSNFFERYKPFETSSAFFSIHYFFNSLENLRGLLWNVNKSMSDGGHFLVTCIDGKKLYDFFDKKELNYEWVIKARERPVFILQKNYLDQNERKDFGFKVSMKSHNIQGISNSFIPEWLVFPEILVEVAKEFGLSVKEITPFENFWSSFSQFDNYLAKNLRDPSLSDLYEFSKMHSVFVFEKTSIDISQKYGLNIDKTLIEKRPSVAIEQVQKNVSSASTVVVSNILKPSKAEPKPKKSRKQPNEQDNETSSIAPLKKPRTKKTNSSLSQQQSHTVNDSTLGTLSTVSQIQPPTSAMSISTPNSDPSSSKKTKIRKSPTKSSKKYKSSIPEEESAKSATTETPFSETMSSFSALVLGDKTKTIETTNEITNTKSSELPSFTNTTIPQVQVMPTTTTTTNSQIELSSEPISSQISSPSIISKPDVVKPKRPYKKRTPKNQTPPKE